MGYKKSKILLSAGEIGIEGSYGEALTPERVESISLADELPKLIMKTNGFAAGNTEIGCFNTSEGEIVKLILDSDNKPFILITKKSEQKIYYSAGEKPNRRIVEEMKKTLPCITSCTSNRTLWVAVHLKRRKYKRNRKKTPNLNHIFQECESGSPAEYATIEQTFPQ